MLVRISHDRIDGERLRCWLFEELGFPRVVDVLGRRELEDVLVEADFLES